MCYLRYLLVGLFSPYAQRTKFVTFGVRSGIACGEVQKKIEEVKSEVQWKIEEEKDEVQRMIGEIMDNVQGKIGEIEKKLNDSEIRPNNFLASPELMYSRPTVKSLTFVGQTSWTVFKTQFDVVSFANG
ncbi:hypothetical protein AVEN_259747-1 [Araneus ventricosus]|uniref:Uncharacterized protein n=1 Tax=Araneus ventricosus TaxID=182803 RepID=A0A4Y2D2X4_ARAVE|nr:hypothetical protein AVEN_259747-1 [Araneus ventricosus]